MLRLLILGGIIFVATFLVEFIIERRRKRKAAKKAETEPKTNTVEIPIDNDRF